MDSEYPGCDVLLIDPLRGEGASTHFTMGATSRQLTTIGQNTITSTESPSSRPSARNRTGAMTSISSAG